MTTSTEQRQFVMHTGLLFDVIRKQAGTLSKAALEAVMNAVDAGAKSVHITIDAQKMHIADDGRGFRNQEEVEKFFEVFGQPHDEAEKKVFGKFRMGRGQLMAFGANRWESGPFVMDVDIKEKGLAYDLHTRAGKVKGCQITIDLYEPLLPSGIGTICRELEHWCKWAPIEVWLNGEVVNCDVTKAKWDHETDDAYLRLRTTGGLAIYNQGIFVMELHNHRYGTGGELVTKVGKDLDVNFARNDILSSCKVWQRLRPLVSRSADHKMRSKASLNSSEQQCIANQIRYGEFEPGPKDVQLKLVTAVTGRHYSVAELSGYRQSSFKYISEGTLQNRKACRLMESRIAFIIARDTLQRFGVRTAPELLKLLDATFPETYKGGLWNAEYRKLEDLVDMNDEEFRVLQAKELTADETLWLRLIEHAGADLRSNGDEDFPRGVPMYSSWSPKSRRLLIGDGAGEAWTDGSTYTALTREFLKSMKFDLKSYARIGLLLIHEGCTAEADTGAHEHDQEFYESFVEACHIGLGEFIAACQRYLPTAIKSCGRQLRKADLAQQDKEAKHEMALSKL